MNYAELIQAAGPYTGGLAAVAAALVWIARLVRTDGKDARQQRASLQRFGARLGQVERLLDLEQIRRMQVEAVLVRGGVPLPPWPADRDDRDPPPLETTGESDRVLDVPETRYIDPEDRAKFARHRR